MKLNAVHTYIVNRIVILYKRVFMSQKKSVEQQQYFIHYSIIKSSLMSNFDIIIDPTSIKLNF